MSMALASVLPIRGLTTQGVPDISRGRAMIDWIAANQLNRLELRVSGSTWSIPLAGFEPLQSESAADTFSHFTELVTYGAARGVDVVAAIGHPDGDRSIVKAYPQTRVGGTLPHPSGHDHAIDSYCFKHETVQAIYQSVVATLVKNTAIQEVQFWLTENNIRCACQACTQGQDVDAHELTQRYFVNQAAVMYDAVVKARKLRPELGVSMWTTQGCRYHLDALIRSLPKDVLWFFYDGERYGNYNLRHLPRTIPDEIHQLHREGYRIGVQLDWASCSGFLPVPSTIRERIYEARHAGFEAVCGWTGIELFDPDKTDGMEHPTPAYAAWMFAHSDDPRPQSFCQCMTHAATKAGLSDPSAKLVGQTWQCIDEHAREIHLADCYCFFWYGVNQLGAVLRRIIHRHPVDELDQRWVDGTWETTIPTLDRAVASLEQQAGKLRGLPETSEILDQLAERCETIAAWGRAVRHILFAGIVYHRQGSWDTTHGPWRDNHEQMRESLTIARQAMRSTEGRVFHRHRVEKTCELIDHALAAVDDAASPQPMAGQDRYPYLSVG